MAAIPMPTLLIVDDNGSVRETLRFVFDHLGFTVVTAGNGAEALAFGENNPVDAALIDIHMPGMNGFDVCRELRGRVQSSGREISVWLITGALAADFPRRAVEAGAVAILGKPFDATALAVDIRARLAQPPPGREPIPTDPPH